MSHVCRHFVWIVFSFFCVGANLYVRNDFGTNDALALYGSICPLKPLRFYGMGQYMQPANRLYPKSKRRMGEAYLGAGYSFCPFGISVNTLLLAGWEYTPYENSFFRIVPGASLCGKYGEVQLYSYLPIGRKKTRKNVQQYSLDAFYQYTFGSRLYCSTLRFGAFGAVKRECAKGYGGVRGQLIVPWTKGFFETKHEWDPIFGYIGQVGLSVNFSGLRCCLRPSVPEPTLWFRTQSSRF